MAQLRALAAQVHRAEQRERARLARLLHDDLQQLLVAALARLELVPGASDPASPAGEVREILRQAIQASRTVTADLSPRYLNERSLTRALRSLAEHMKDRHGLTVDLQGPESAELERLTDERRTVLLQSVRELLFNVVKHSGVRTAQVTLHVRPGMVDVVVEDCGRGLPARAHDPEPHEGSGFGLIGMRERLEYLGCGLLLASEPGQYTRVTVQAPLDPPQNRRPRALNSKPVACEREPGRRPIRVLLADNHRVIRESLGALLSAEGDIQIVGEAADGREAVTAAMRLRPDVIVMDVGMPGLDGIDATRQIVKHLPDVRVVSLTRHEEAETTAAMLDAGAEACVTKGGPTSDLIAAIHGHR